MWWVAKSVSCLLDLLGQTVLSTCRTFCDGDPGEYTHTACLNLWCWNFFLLHKSLMHIHKFMSAFIKFSRPLKYCAHAPSVPGLSDQLPASKHQLNVKWGHKLLDRLHYQRLADDPEQPRGHHRPSVSITSCPLTLSLSGQTPACPLSPQTSRGPVSFPLVH